MQAFAPVCLSLPVIYLQYQGKHSIYDSKERPEIELRKEKRARTIKGKYMMKKRHTLNQLILSFGAGEAVYSSFCRISHCHNISPAFSAPRRVK